MSESDSVDRTAEQESPATFGPRLVQNTNPPFIPEGAARMTFLVERLPGHPGIPPHRRSGPCFGYHELVKRAHPRAPQADPPFRHGKADNG
ncbi:MULTISPECIES: hypothetical protein [unclassified Streptomyces]|uniref:hypothetical protein n=1 Tax=unclassified Streptomyces TaxID=2593676 RepID=UPI003D8F1BB4